MSENLKQNLWSPISSWFWWAIVLLLLLGNLGGAPIYILDEAKNAQCAREMYESGNWLIPTFNGQLRTDKPPLHYWVMATSFSFFGVGEWQARLGSVLMGLATLLLVFFWVRHWLGKATAMASLITIISSTHFLFECRLAVPDPYLIFFTTLSLLCGFAFLQEGRSKWLWLTALGMGCATLAKGPVAIALPGLVLLVFALIQGKWRKLLDGRLVLAFIVLIVIVLPWYWQVHVATNGAFTKGFFLDHNLNRFAGEMEGHGGNFFLTPLMVIVGMLPFSLLLPGIYPLRKQVRENSMLLFAGIAVLVYIVFFGISSTKLPNYAMPCYPMLAILLGFLLNNLWEKRRALPIVTAYILLIIALVLPLAAFLGIRAEPALKNWSWLCFGMLVLPLGIFIVIRIGSKLPLLSMKLFAFSWCVFSAYFFWVGYPLIYQQNPVAAINSSLSNFGNHHLIAYQTFNPAFLFNNKRLGNRMEVVGDNADLVAFAIEKAKDGKPVFVVTRLDRFPQIDTAFFSKVAMHRDLFELPTTVLLRFRNKSIK